MRRRSLTAAFLTMLSLAVPLSAVSSRAAGELPGSSIDEVGHVRAWEGVVTVSEVGRREGRDANASGRVESSIDIHHQCSVHFLVVADPDEVAPVTRWDGEDEMSCNVSDSSNADVWDIDDRHVGDSSSRSHGSATVPVTPMLVIDPDAGTYSLEPGDPYIDVTTDSDDNGYANTATMSTGVYTHWRTMLIEDQPLTAWPLTGTIKDPAPYLPAPGISDDAPVSTVISWTLAPLGWIPEDDCSQGDTTPLSGLLGERPDALRDAIADALTTAGHPTTPGMVHIGGTDDAAAGLLTFAVRMTPDGRTLPTIDCLQQAIDAGRVPEGSLEGALRLLLGSEQATDSGTRVYVRTVETETGEILAASKGTVTGSGAAATASAAAAAVGALDLGPAVP
jgi:hypothetical protein